MLTMWKVKGFAAIMAVWGFVDVVSAQPRALLFDDGPVSFDFRQALMDEGVSFRRALNWMQFAAYLEEEPYDFVVVSVQMARNSDWTALIEYVNSGRPAILTYFDLLHSPELAAAFECNVTASLDDEVVSSIVQSYGHAIWTGLAGRLDLELKGAIDNGDIITAAGTAEVVGEFESGGGAIVNAFLTNDAVTTANAVQFARNEISLLLGQTPPCDPFVVTTTADKGCGSLRKAIIEANKAAGPVTITFNIPPSDSNYNGGAPKIMPPEPLPEVTGTGITIDGATQPGFDPATGKMVVISGEAAFGGDGLTIGGDGNAVYDLVINGFRAGGRGVCVKGDNGLISGCRVGTDPTGATPVPNTIGIRVIGSAKDNSIGDDNIIAFNTSHGVALYSSATGNTVRGSAFFNNGGKGISFWGSGADYPNDPGDADAGPNNQQNKPEVCGVLITGSESTVTFLINSDTARSAYPLRNCNKITCSICITAGRSCSSNLRGTYLDAA